VRLRASSLAMAKRTFHNIKIGCHCEGASPEAIYPFTDHYAILLTLRLLRSEASLAMTLLKAYVISSFIDAPRVIADSRNAPHHFCYEQQGASPEAISTLARICSFLPIRRWRANELATSQSLPIRLTLTSRQYIIVDKSTIFHRWFN
jgi:hypothetical protein